MKLILIRHAKSGWDDAFADDFDRELTARGERASVAIGTWLVDRGHVPLEIHASDAQRTRQTADGIMAVISPKPLLALYPALYHASPDTIAQIVRRTTAESLAVIGHNPGIAMLAQGLVRNRPSHPRFQDYPTCATTVIEIERSLTPGTGHCEDFIVPRDLTD